MIKTSKDPEVVVRWVSCTKSRQLYIIHRQRRCLFGSKNYATSVKVSYIKEAAPLVGKLEITGGQAF